MTKVSDLEVQAREGLFVIPESEKDRRERTITLRWMKGGIAVGILMAGMLLALWVIPYASGIYD